MALSFSLRSYYGIDQKLTFVNFAYNANALFSVLIWPRIETEGQF